MGFSPQASAEEIRITALWPDILTLSFSAAVTQMLVGTSWLCLILYNHVLPSN